MKNEIALTRLKGVPKDVCDSLMADRENLPPGAITTIARFFDLLEARGEHSSAPSLATFRSACSNESALGLLLRTLEKYAPAACLAEGRILRSEYYKNRKPSSGDDHHDVPQSGKSKKTLPRNWPPLWSVLLPDLNAAPIADSSINRYIASVNRCAVLVPYLRCPPRLGWLFAWELSQALLNGDEETARAPINARTAATYIGGLVGLGLHGGLDQDALDGIRSVQAHLQRRGRQTPKAKETRIEALYAKGGYSEVARVVSLKLDEADEASDWRAEAEVARATAAVLAVCMNEPARTGDVASWTFGKDLVREPTGKWRLRWRQRKTGHWKDAGVLWPETCAVLDEHILGGRERHHAYRRFQELAGCNWLSLQKVGYDGRWPSEKVKGAIGVPLHDLRTLAADYLRLHDPVAAPRIVRVLLGHRSARSGEEYVALCSETAAQRVWQEIRADYAQAPRNPSGIKTDRKTGGLPVKAKTEGLVPQFI